ncbi:MAG: hypothetical protein AABX11_03965, partial [Nanoarchaeota archaeon]
EHAAASGAAPQAYGPAGRDGHGARGRPGLRGRGRGQAGGGGGGGSKTYIIGELSGGNIVEFSNGEKISFNISLNTHTVTLKNHTNTSAMIEIKSEAQTFTLNVGEEIQVDLNSDNVKDILVKLKEINATSGKVTLVITRLAGADKYAEETEKERKENNGSSKDASPVSPETQKVIYIVIGILVVIMVISFIIYLVARKNRKAKWGER